MKRNVAAGTSQREDESSFPEVQFFQKQSSSSLLPPPLSSFQSTQVYIVFKCQREKEKRERSVCVSERKPFGSGLSRSGEGKRGESRVAELKRCRFFCVSLSLFRAPLLPPSPPPLPPPVALKCHMQPFAAERGVGVPRVGMNCPSNLQVQAVPFLSLYLLFLVLSRAFSRCCLGWKSLGVGGE